MELFSTQNKYDSKYSKKADNELIISLTSYPPRINTACETVKTLLNQSMKANKVILWLAKEQFPNKEKDLPVQLLDLTKQGLTIKWCKDIKSYKKLIPALAEYPDAVIVTFDDDVLYDENVLKELYDAYSEHPEHIQRP